MDNELARKTLDRRFVAIPAEALHAPHRGWIRAIRDALGMTATQLAGRMGVTQPRIAKLEQAERTGAVTLASLEKAADALGCTLVYALVPRQSLEQAIHDRAEEKARQQLARIRHSMALEDQATGTSALADELHALTQRYIHDPRGLWDD